MAGNHRSSTDHVERLEPLQQHPYRFGFYEAVRLLDCVYSQSPRTGESLRAHDERLRIGQEPSLAFAPASLASFGQPAANAKWRLQTYLFGMFGPNGALPLHLTEHARDRLRRHRDPTFSRFADLFHHRMASLFYRAWASAQPTVHLDRPESDRFANYVGALCGLGMEALQDRDAMPDHAKLFFCGHLSNGPRHGSGLQAILGGYFHCPVELLQFVGHWIELPNDCRMYLGQSARTGTLGETSTLGARVWDMQQKFRVVVGPLSYEQYCRLLPGGCSLQRLVAIIRNYVGDEFFWDARLVLKQSEVPALQLGRRGQLGWTSWLTSRPLADNADDLVLNPMQAAGDPRYRTAQN